MRWLGRLVCLSARALLLRAGWLCILAAHQLGERLENTR